MSTASGHGRSARGMRALRPRPRQGQRQLHHARARAKRSHSHARRIRGRGTRIRNARGRCCSCAWRNAGSRLTASAHWRNAHGMRALRLRRYRERRLPACVRVRHWNPRLAGRWKRSGNVEVPRQWRRTHRPPPPRRMRPIPTDHMKQTQADWRHRKQTPRRLSTPRSSPLRYRPSRSRCWNRSSRNHCSAPRHKHCRRCPRTAIFEAPQRACRCRPWRRT